MRSESNQKPKPKIAKPTAPEKKAGKRSITELRGLGAHIWEGVDVAEYIRKERDSWDS